MIVSFATFATIFATKFASMILSFATFATTSSTFPTSRFCYVSFALDLHFLLGCKGGNRKPFSTIVQTNINKHQHNSMETILAKIAKKRP